MPLWFARVLVILIHLVGWGGFLAFGIYLKLNVPDWMDRFGTLTVAGVAAGIMGTIIALTYAIEIALERRRERQ